MDEEYSIGISGKVEIKGKQSIDKVTESINKIPGALNKVENKSKSTGDSISNLVKNEEQLYKDLLKLFKQNVTEIDTLYQSLKKVTGEAVSATQKISNIKSPTAQKGFIGKANRALDRSLNNQAIERELDKWLRNMQSQNKVRSIADKVYGRDKNLPDIYRNSWGNGFQYHRMNGPLKDLSPTAEQIKREFQKDRQRLLRLEQHSPLMLTDSAGLTKARREQAIRQSFWGTPKQNFQEKNALIALTEYLKAEKNKKDSNWYTASKAIQTSYSKRDLERDRRNGIFSREAEELKTSHQSKWRREYELQQMRSVPALGYDPYSSHSPDPMIASNLSQKIQDSKKQYYQMLVNEVRAEEKENEKQLTAEKEITAAKEKEAKKVKDKSTLTANQARKYEEQAKRTAATIQRTNEMAEDRKRKDKEYADKEWKREFEKKHPYLFAQGGENWNWRIKAGAGLNKIGSKAISVGGLPGYIAGNGLNTIGDIIKGPATGVSSAVSMVANAFVDASQKMLQAYSEVEAIKTQLGVVFSSQSQADSTFNEISKYAVKSPFGVQQTSELAILLKQSGVYATDLMDTLKMLGDTAGGNMEKMKRIANNYAQIVSIGKASMLDMRQFAYAGIPIFEAVSKELGVSQQELRKLISDGKVTSDIIEKVFKDLTGINGLFENATAKGAKTLKARLQNMQDAKQLMFSAQGERMTLLGTGNGGEGLVKNIVTSLENIYQALYKNSQLIAIEKSVRNIEQKELLMQQLQSQLEEAKKSGNKVLQGALEARIEKLSMPSIEETRAKRSEEYELKQDYFNDTLKEIKKYIDIESKSYSEIMDSYQLLKDGYNQDWVYKANFNTLADKDPTSQVAKYREILESLDYNLKDVKEFKLAFDRYVESFNDFRQMQYNINDVRTIAYNEKQAELYSTKASDLSNHYGDNKDSVFASLQELTSLYKNSDEYKKKEEEKRQKELKQAQDYLKEIAKNTKDGTIDFSKHSAEQLLEMQKKGLFSGATKLTVAPDKDKDKMEKDFKTVQSQFLKMGTYVKDLYNKNASGKQKERDIKDLTSWLSVLGDASSAEKFYKDFPRIFGDFEKRINTWVEKGVITKDVAENMKNAIGLSTLKGRVDLSALNADISDLVKGSVYPLWKRILSQATGVSVAAINNTSDTMDFYHENLATRQMASRVLGAGVKNGLSVDTIQKLTGYRSQKAQLEGDYDKVWQIDWRRTRQELHKFATALSTSTAVVNALTESYEQEYDTITDLISGGVLSSETEGVSKAKYISSKQLEKAITAIGEQGVNAFGEKLYGQKEDGTEVLISKIENGKYYDEKGVQVAVDSFRIEGKIYEVCKNYLAVISKDIAEAKAASIKNAVLEAQYKATSSTFVKNNLLSGSSNPALVGFIESYAEQAEAMFARNLEEYTRNDTGKFSDLSGSDILMKAITGEVEALEVIKPILDKTRSELEELVNNESYKKGEDAIVDAKIGEVNREAYLKLFGANTGNERTVGGKGPYAESLLTHIFASELGLENGASLRGIANLGSKTFRAKNEEEQNSLRYKKGVINETQVITAEQLNKLNEQKSKINSSAYAKQAYLSNDYKADKIFKEDEIERAKTVKKYIKGLGTGYEEELKTATEQVKKLSQEKLELELQYKKESLCIELDRINKLKNFYLNSGISEQSSIMRGLNRDEKRTQRKIDKLDSNNNEIGDLKTTLNTIGIEKMTKAIQDLNNSLYDLGREMAQKAFLAPFESWGKALAEVNNELRESGRQLNYNQTMSKAIEKAYREIGAEILSNMGSYMAQAGFQIAAAAALQQNWAGVIGGLSLAAAGGFASGFGSAIDTDTKKDDDDKLNRLEALKNSLLEIINQAKIDAAYYENHLRHQRAISITEGMKSVNDAIISPSGDIITTHPDDYLIATKQPKSLVGGNTYSPNINFSIINESGTAMTVSKTETKQNQNGDLDIIAYVKGAVGEGIAKGEFDDSFNYRDMRLRGTSYSS